MTVASALVAIGACSSFTATDTPPDGATDGGGEDSATTGDAPPAPEAGDDAAHGPPGDGCSDGTREGYAGAPRIAACAGYWTAPGITAPLTPTCDRQAGNDGTNAAGSGCSAGDLCAAGWHVCLGRIDVIASLPLNDTGGPCKLASDPDSGVLLYATAQASGGNASCGATVDGGSVNDVLGCGDLPTQPANDCKPLNSVLATGHPVDGWAVSGDTTERATVVHLSGNGGVLCCQD